MNRDCVRELLRIERTKILAAISVQNSLVYREDCIAVFGNAAVLGLLDRMSTLDSPPEIQGPI
jgi:hypothetical protein